MVATRKMCLKLRPGGAAILLSGKLREKSKQKTRTGSHRIITPELPKCLLRLSLNPQCIFIINTESYQEKRHCLYSHAGKDNGLIFTSLLLPL